MSKTKDKKDTRTYEEKMRDFRERNGLPQTPLTHRNDSESEKGFSDCIADMKCINTVINVFFYTLIASTIWLMLSGVYDWITNLF